MTFEMPMLKLERDKLRHAMQAYHESYCGELQQMKRKHQHD